MDWVTFDSHYDIRGYLPAFDEAQIQAEPMLLSADAVFAAEHGGPITRAVLERLPGGWLERPLDLRVETRVHQLLPGWFPAIPGWHLDGVPRTRPDRQPDHTRPDPTEFVIGCVGPISLTTFAAGRIRLPEPGPGEVNSSTLCADTAVYEAWHPLIEAAIDSGELSRQVLPDRALAHFAWGALHKANAASAAGWRFFVRVRFGSPKPAQNELRRQTQVFLPTAVAGL